MLKFFVTMQTLFIAGTDRLKGDNEKGATAVEYGIMVALIAAVIVVVVGFVGQDVLRAFQTVDGALP
ncbi:Flp family type IVb pilin [Arthrobacter sp. HLT1-20]